MCGSYPFYPCAPLIRSLWSLQIRPHTPLFWFTAGFPLIYSLDTGAGWIRCRVAAGLTYCQIAISRILIALVFEAALAHLVGTFIKFQKVPFLARLDKARKLRAGHTEAIEVDSGEQKFNRCEAKEGPCPSLVF